MRAVLRLDLDVPVLRLPGQRVNQIVVVEVVVGRALRILHTQPDIMASADETVGVVRHLRRRRDLL